MNKKNLIITIFRTFLQVLPNAFLNLKRATFIIIYSHSHKSPSKMMGWNYFKLEYPCVGLVSLPRGACLCYCGGLPMGGLLILTGHPEVSL